jgi:hypothetical protein
MPKQIRARLTYANVMATWAVFLGLAGGAYALSGVPDGSGVYHACVDDKTGVLRVVKTASSCRRAKTVKRGKRLVRIPGESAIAWNQQGRAGANGTNGLNGASGANGANGATKVVVRVQTNSIGAGGSASTHVDCNPGERAVGGGASYADGGAGGGSKLTQSAPAQAGQAGVSADGATPTAWAVGWDGAGPPSPVRFYAICASP